MAFNLTAEERETIITWNDADKRPMIHTGQKPMITALLSNPNFEMTDEVKENGRTILLTGWLAEGSITVRNKAKGQIRRRQSKRTGMPSNAARCGQMTAAGKPCQSLASKATGKCAKHSK